MMTILEKLKKNELVTESVAKTQYGLHTENVFKKVAFFLFCLISFAGVESASAATEILNEKNYRPNVLQYEVVGDSIQLQFSDLEVENYYVNVCSKTKEERLELNCSNKKDNYSHILPKQNKVTIPLRYVGDAGLVIADTKKDGTRSTLAYINTSMTDPSYLSSSFISDKDNPYVDEIIESLFKGTKKLNSTFKVKKVHNYMVNTYKYDYELFERIDEVDFVYPDFEKMKTKKIGICYDIASLYTAILRKMDIPTKLEVGWAINSSNEKVFHAWVSVKDGKVWKIIDPTWDLHSKEFKYRDRKDYEVVYTY